MLRWTMAASVTRFLMKIKAEAGFAVRSCVHIVFSSVHCDGVEDDVGEFGVFGGGQGLGQSAVSISRPTLGFLKKAARSIS